MTSTLGIAYHGRAINALGNLDHGAYGLRFMEMALAANAIRKPELAAFHHASPAAIHAVHARLQL